MSGFAKRKYERFHLKERKKMVDITCISDLHGFYPELPGGDLLIVAGDLTARDTWDEYKDFFDWLSVQKYEKKILVAGNHDNMLNCLHKIPNEKTDLEYLCDSATEFNGFKIWGSPWTKTFDGMNPNCKAFTCDTEEELAKKFSLIPEDVDILITHSPPSGIFDHVDRFGEGQHVGSEALSKRLSEIKPSIIIFGHIHEGYGKESASYPPFSHDIIHVNASHVNKNYKPINKPIRIKI